MVHTGLADATDRDDDDDQDLRGLRMGLPLVLSVFRWLSFNDQLF